MEARGADSLSRGLRALQEVGPGEGETLEEWAHRIGDGCGWGEDRGAPLTTEKLRASLPEMHHALMASLHADRLVLRSFFLYLWAF